MQPWKDGAWVVGDLYNGGDMKLYLARGMHAAVTVNVFISNMIESYHD